MATIEGDGGAALRKLAVRLAEMPNRLRPEVRATMKAVGGEIREDAAQRASFSRRIPASLKVVASFSATRAGVYVLASARTAPQARNLEGITGRSVERHPLNYPSQRGLGLFGQSPVRPFLAPALAAKQDEAIERVNDAVTRALSGSGL